MEDYIESIKHMGLNIHMSVEETPLGTAGPLKLVEHLLKQSSEG